MERIEEPRTARSRKTRGAILDGAWALLEEGSAEALSMEAVAQRAGVSRRAIYLHFASRTELLMSLVAHMDTTLDLEASVQTITDAPDAVAMLRAWTKHLARYHPRILRVVRAVNQARRTDADAATVWQHAMELWHRGCREIVSRLVAEGRLAAPWTRKTAADMLWALMSVDVLEGLTYDREWSNELYGERLFTLVSRALVAEPRPGRRKNAPA